MAARSVRAFIHNDTDYALVKTNDECPHGEWTTRAPDRIEAHSIAMMRSESNFLGGVESRATYVIGGVYTNELYVHWNNPTIGSNSFHTNAKGGFYSFWAAPTSGSDPVAHFVLRPAGKVETDFLPSHDGFHFDNKWPNMPYSLPPLRGTILDYKLGNAKNGLCGGMVLGSLDYYVAGLQIPNDTTPPLRETNKLFQHLVNRIFDTFNIDSVSLMLKLMNPLYPDGDENVLSTFGLANGRAAVMAHQEWPLIRSDIDAGKPSPICIITVKSLNPGDLGDNHQLLAYAYEVSGHDVTVHLYDCNQPNADNIYMKFNDGDISNRIVVEHNVAVGNPRRPIYCFIRLNNGPRPVPYPTQPRLTGAERKARRVQIARDDQTILSSRKIAEGTRVYEVGPNCGEHEFPYVIAEEAIKATVSVTTPYYREPKLAWTINGLTVAEGPAHTFYTAADKEYPQDSPIAPTTGDDARRVALNVTLQNNRLEILNTPSDGNYTLVVQITAKDGDDVTSISSRSTSIDITGLRSTIIGFESASAECWKKYIKDHQSEQTPVGAVAAVIASQLGRPSDPLWDPDPTMLKLGNLVNKDDPLKVELTKWQTDWAAHIHQQDLLAGIAHPGGAGSFHTRQLFTDLPG